MKIVLFMKILYDFQHVFLCMTSSRLRLYDTDNTDIKKKTVESSDTATKLNGNNTDVHSSYHQQLTLTLFYWLSYCKHQADLKFILLQTMGCL